MPSFLPPLPSLVSLQENGALDMAKAFAEAQDCDIVLANDPDADRLAVAEKDRSTGIWTIFSGDQIGTMLGLWIWERIGKGSDKVSFQEKVSLVEKHCVAAFFSVYVCLCLVGVFFYSRQYYCPFVCLVSCAVVFVTASFYVHLGRLLQDAGRDRQERGIPRRGEPHRVQVDRFSVGSSPGRGLPPSLWLRGGHRVCVVSAVQCSAVERRV
jgi:hypothetical protein